MAHSGKRYLAIDGDAAFHDNESRAWVEHGVTADRVNSMVEGIMKASKFEYFFIAINSANVDFLPLLKNLRAVTNSPILVAADKFDSKTHEEALRKGADAYGPIEDAEFNVKTVLAIIERIMAQREQNESKATVLAINNILVFPDEHRVILGSNEVGFTKAEVGVLSCLIKNKQRAMSCEQLYKKIFSAERKSDPYDSITNIVKRIRKKIKGVCEIVNIKGLGYKIKEVESIIVSAPNITEKISVIVPIYNSEAFLEKCINSILNQTYPNIEIILINDGSTDNSGMICKNFQAKCGNVVYIDVGANRGVSHARNLGIKSVTGSLIGFVDSDDWIEEDMYMSLYDAITAHIVPIVSANFTMVYSDTKRAEAVSSLHFNQLLLDNVVDALSYSIGKRDCMLWNKLYRREVFEGVQFPEGKVYEDVDVVHLLVENAKGRMATLTKCVYNYYIRPDSITRNKKMPIRFFENLDAAVNRHKYLSEKYSSTDLERLCRMQVFKALANIVDRLNHIDVSKDDDVSVLFNSARSIVYGNYSYEDCGFVDAEKKLFALLQKSVVQYKVGRDLIMRNM